MYRVEIGRDFQADDNIVKLFLFLTIYDTMTFDLQSSQNEMGNECCRKNGESFWKNISDPLFTESYITF